MKKEVEESEIHAQIDIANQKINDGETSGFMTYEDGVKDALHWILGIGCRPLDDPSEEGVE